MVRFLLSSSLMFMSLFTFSLYAQITVPYADRHSTVISDAWVSQTKRTSANPSRGSVHWIQYDLGGVYALDKMKIWNINTPDLLTVGARIAIIDYSLDGKTWKEWGKIEIEKGSGSINYQGQDGPNFSGLVTRYLLFSITENHGHLTETGLAEIKVNLKPATVPVKDIISEIKLVAFPNPFVQSVEIDLGEIEDFSDLYYQVTNVSGQVLMNEKIRSRQVQIDGQNLSSGIYTFSVIHPSGKQSIQLTLAK
jgi:hypothetical protein